MTKHAMKMICRGENSQNNSIHSHTFCRYKKTWTMKMTTNKL